jgi:hypothetical protein
MHRAGEDDSGRPGCVSIYAESTTRTAKFARLCRSLPTDLQSLIVVPILVARLTALLPTKGHRGHDDWLPHPEDDEWDARVEEMAERMSRVHVLLRSRADGGVAVARRV